jgi:hypothetical protein
MSDNRFNQYIVEDETPNEVVKLEKPVLKKELTAPVAPPSQQSILPPGVMPPPLPSQMNATLGAPVPTTPVAAPIDINALKEQAQQLKKEIGPATAPNILPKDLSPYTVGAVGTGLLAGTLGVGYLLSKKNSVSDRDIRKIEPELNVNKQPQPGVTEPVYHEPQFTDMPTEAEKLSAESMKMKANNFVDSTIAEKIAAEEIKLQPSELTGYLNNKYGTTPSNIGQLLPHANQASPEFRANFAPYLIKLMNEGKIINRVDADVIAKAQDAGVTGNTSPPEAETLVATKANSQTPEEKLNQAVDIADSVKPATMTKEGVPVPEGRIPNYMEFKTKKGGAKEFKNKQGSDVIGKGGYNWYQGQMGPEAETNWLHQFGRTNQSYQDVVQAIKEGRLKGPAVNEVGRGGSFPREATVPNFIKGNASLGAMASTGLIAGLLGLAGSEKGQEAMAKASKAIKDLGVSPDIFTNKAEELGNLGSSYVTAGNPTYQRELVQKLNSTKDPEFRNFLMQELQKLPTSGSGIAPPMR